MLKAQSDIASGNAKVRDSVLSIYSTIADIPSLKTVQDAYKMKSELEDNKKKIYDEDLSSTTLPETGTPIIGS
ncbi:hypothetical protein AAGV27_21405 [Bacillus velezensis]